MIYNRVAVDDMQGFRLDWVRKRGTELFYHLSPLYAFGGVGTLVLTSAPTYLPRAYPTLSQKVQD